MTSLDISRNVGNSALSPRCHFRKSGPSRKLRLVIGLQHTNTEKCVGRGNSEVHHVSLGIAFKGPEGIVLAADSRVTLSGQLQGPQNQIVLVPATFDNATKLLKAKGQDHVGAVTYGMGAIGQQEPRTAHSFLPEFEASLEKNKRLSVEDFAKKLSGFFLARWNDARMPNPAPGGQDMIFLVGGYDREAAYGKVFEIFIPSRPAPREMIPVGVFGAVWGGQREIADRLLTGFDFRAPQIARDFLRVPNPAQAGQPDPLEVDLKTKLSAKIPWAFLPLQDCVDLSIFMLRATITLQKWVVDIRGVGGAIDVATITRTEGFRYVQQKQVAGEER
jgi:hypothetical protein